LKKEHDAGQITLAAQQPAQQAAQPMTSDYSDYEKVKVSAPAPAAKVVAKTNPEAKKAKAKSK
jgi:hypothetical protein